MQEFCQVSSLKVRPYGRIRIVTAYISNVFFKFLNVFILYSLIVFALFLSVKHRDIDIN